jgi:surfeit locus 1 family protein
MTIIVFKRNWVVHWYWAIINLLVIAILLSLSYWQWQRAAQKQQSLDQLAHWQAQPATSLTELTATESQHRVNLLARDGASVSFTGRWVSPFVWLLDNQLVNGRPGYDVVIPVQELSGAASAIVLVNLGWVVAPSVRTELPEINIPTEIVVQGIYRARTDALLLGKNLEDQGRWPMRLQKIDNQLLAPYLSAELLPGLIYQQQRAQQQTVLQQKARPQPVQQQMDHQQIAEQQNAKQQTSFLVHYRPVVLPPERHKAYALQWLLLAVAALLVGMACARETAHQYETVCIPNKVAAITPNNIVRKNPLPKSNASAGSN